MRSCHVLLCIVAVSAESESELYCWLFAVQGCRSEPEWLVGTPRVLEDASLGSGFTSRSLPDRCWHFARETWIKCQNPGLEAVDFALAPNVNAANLLPHDEAIPDFRSLAYTGSYPSMGTQGLLQQLEEDSFMRAFFSYQVSFWWANKEMTQFSDTDLSRPVCNGLWSPVKERANKVAATNESQFCGSCSEQLQDMWQRASSDVDFVEFPFSAAKADCFLGVVTLTLTELLCVHSCAAFSEDEEIPDWDIHGVLWKKAQLELEGLFFFFDFPLALLASSGWPIVTLMRRLGEAFRLNFGNVIPNDCDLLDGERADGLFSKIQVLLAGNELDLPQIREIADIASAFLDEVDSTCPFAVGTALLSLLRAAQMSSVVQISDSDFSFLTLDALKTWDAMNGERVGHKRHYFYDLLTTRWPWLSLLEQVNNSRKPQTAKHWPIDQLAIQEEVLLPRCVDRVMASRETWEWHWSQSPFQAHGREVEKPKDFAKLAERLCELEGMEVLFLSGTSSGFKWGSFTVRGRQVARGLRQLLPIGPNIKARAWNQDCTNWCSDVAVYGKNWSNPAIVVHVKFPCKCAMEVLANRSNSNHSLPPALHVYDHVDLFSLVPEGMAVFLAQTSLAAQDYGTHPSVVASGMEVFWHPLHHSNMENYRIPWRDQVQMIGTHTVHNDTELYGAVGLLAQNLGVQFQHIDPMERFASTAGLVITPQQTQQVYEQFGEMDITVLRHAGCMEHLNCITAR
ncbi:unnamed protein product [Durusdinium trenchii]|uniref:Uncharacterized protein n=2 Tax=Durusdinium trenchii TaxID=1381693 RepID=A0ABP0H960_9DINO